MSSISYQGVPGSYSHIAATEYFGEPHTYVGTKRFREIFENIKEGKTEYGVIPIENTVAGSIYENYDYLDSYPVYAVGEYAIKVQHQLLVHQETDPGTDFKTIISVFSHPKALEQCTKFFDAHPHMQEVVFSDTAGAAQMVSQKVDPTYAAIASIKAAEIYNLKIAKANIEDNPHNYTRFLVISGEKEAVADANKCSLIVTLAHTPGSLHKALSALATDNINLTKIESRPIVGKPFEYVFYIDVEFEPGAKSVIEEVTNNNLNNAVHSCKVLGIYKSKQS